MELLHHGFFGWKLIGLVAGILGKMIMPGKDPGGFIVTILIGIVGAVIGGFIGTQLGFGSVIGFNLPSIGIAILGALVLLLVLRLVRRR